MAICHVDQPHAYGLDAHRDRAFEKSVEGRMHANFARVGQHLGSAMGKIADEQKNAQFVQ